MDCFSFLDADAGHRCLVRGAAGEPPLGEYS